MARKTVHIDNIGALKSKLASFYGLLDTLLHKYKELKQIPEDKVPGWRDENQRLFSDKLENTITFLEQEISKIKNTLEAFTEEHTRDANEIGDTIRG